MNILQNINWESKRLEIVALALFLLLCYFPIFHHLGVPPIKGWDEGLFGMRMLYLYETGDYLPAFSAFPGEVVHYNLKPPLMTFVQTLFFPVLENSDLELTLRLPIALCVLGTVVLMLWYSKKESGKHWWGMIASLVLLTSEGYTRVHVGRTGDHDAALAMFMLIGVFAFLRYLNAQNSRERKRHLTILTLLLLLSFLTKSIVGFFFVPGFVIYAALQKQLLPILKRPSTYVAAIS
ncbi:MAG: glycosyltransferase family 39 protein, partial [Bacteroidota bacterium]